MLGKACATGSEGTCVHEPWAHPAHWQEKASSSGPGPGQDGLRCALSCCRRAGGVTGPWRWPPLQVWVPGRPTSASVPEAAGKSPQGMEGKALLLALRGRLPFLPQPHTHPKAPLGPGSAPASPSRMLAPKTPLPPAQAHRPFASGSPLSSTPSRETPLVLLLWRTLRQWPFSSVSAGPCSPPQRARLI